MAMAKVTSKGQVTIPSEIRKTLDIREGDSLLFELPSGADAVLRLIKSRRLDQYKGVFSTAKRFPGKRKLRVAIRRDIAERIKKEE